MRWPAEDTVILSREQAEAWMALAKLPLCGHDRAVEGLPYTVEAVLERAEDGQPTPEWMTVGWEISEDGDIFDTFTRSDKRTYSFWTVPSTNPFVPGRHNGWKQIVRTWSYTETGEFYIAIPPGSVEREGNWYCINYVAFRAHSERVERFNRYCGALGLDWDPVSVQKPAQTLKMIRQYRNAIRDERGNVPVES